LLGLPGVLLPPLASCAPCCCCDGGGQAALLRCATCSSNTRDMNSSLMAPCGVGGHTTAAHGTQHRGEAGGMRKARAAHA
jgi:hypothetical protein